MTSRAMRAQFTLRRIGRSSCVAGCSRSFASAGVVVGREPLLFTPGPLTTSATVKQAMLVDYGSRDRRFLEACRDVEERLLHIAGVSKETGYECVIMQGCGTMGVEAMLGSVIPRGGKVLIVTNGSYGQRQTIMCRYMGIDFEALSFGDRIAFSVEDVLKELKKGGFTHLSVVHHETTAGVLNPVEELARKVKAQFPNVSILVDSMSGFGGYDLQLKWGIDFAVSSANKCIEGVPGFSYVLCSREALLKTEGNARSLSMDVLDQWKYIQATGQFRYTPPTHAVLAFQQALKEWEAEGGLSGRAARYRENYEALRIEMEAIGFQFYVSEDVRSFLICTFMVPDHPNFDFDSFYQHLSDEGFVIYPGKLASGQSFRIGVIGRLFPNDCRRLADTIRSVCKKMAVPMPLPPPKR